MSSVSAREQFDARVMELIDQFFDPQTTSAVVTELQTLGIPDEDERAAICVQTEKCKCTSGSCQECRTFAVSIYKPKTETEIAQCKKCVTRTKAFIGDAARRKFDQVEKQRRKAEALQQELLTQPDSKSNKKK